MGIEQGGNGEQEIDIELRETQLRETLGFSSEQVENCGNLLESKIREAEERGEEFDLRGEIENSPQAIPLIMGSGEKIPTKEKVNLVINKLEDAISFAKSELHTMTLTELGKGPGPLQLTDPNSARLVNMLNAWEPALEKLRGIRSSWENSD